MVTMVALAVSTLGSEDLACLAAALLIQRGQLSAMAGIIACALGILLGDWGLWALGRAGGHALRASPWLAGRLSSQRFDELRTWLNRNDGIAIVGSRFLPGTRLPLYVTAGIVEMPATRFVLWTLVAVSVWTPSVVLSAAWSAEIASASSSTLAGDWLAPAAVACLLVLWRQSPRLYKALPLQQASARLARWRRWEFWPMWLFYSPVVVWTGLLAVRYGGFGTITAANPGITDGGVVGESKFEILSKLPADCTIPAVLVRPGPLADRVQHVRRSLHEREWTFPLIVKPDVGQRGVGVRLARSIDDVSDYLARLEAAVIVQPYHEGPFEAGVFYYRMPGWSRGRILSITDKRFPFVVGDGQSTLENLIWAHPRYRLQASLFLERHAASGARVLEQGERFQLAIAGNHAQGTMFCDGSHLQTVALERRIDKIAVAYPGFFVGRFDIRYRNVDEFKAGRDIAVVELNGATAESTNIYDPRASLVGAYRQLFRQWSIVFAIGAANRERGAAVTTTRRLLNLINTHLKTEVAFAISD